MYTPNEEQKLIESRLGLDDTGLPRALRTIVFWGPLYLIVWAMAIAMAFDILKPLWRG